MKQSTDDIRERGVLHKAMVMAILTDYHWGRYDLMSATEKILALDTANKGGVRAGHFCPYYNDDCPKCKPTPKPSLIVELGLSPVMSPEVHLIIEKINEIVRYLNADQQ